MFTGMATLDSAKAFFYLLVEHYVWAGYHSLVMLIYSHTTIQIRDLLFQQLYVGVEEQQFHGHKFL